MAAGSPRRPAGLRALAAATDRVLHGAAAAGRRLPIAHPARYGVEVIRDVPYLNTGRAAHRLDVYRPTNRPGPHPVVLYVHGGGFSILSKESHWLLALIFARRGYLVFNINYRLSPKHPFPAAAEDTFAAYQWLTRHAPDYGGDLDRVVLAGESAGGNLVTALAVACCYPHETPWARAVWDTGIVPRAVVPASAILQVSDAARFGRRRPMSPRISEILRVVGRSYLGEVERDRPDYLDFADPLCVLEQACPPQRSLPAFFASVGTRDPLLDDTRRLEAALDRLNVPVEAHYYSGNIHVFHAFLWRRAARRCWRDTFAFLKQHVGAEEQQHLRAV